MIFINRRFFLRQEFELLSSTLKIKKQSLLETFEYEISYEYIDDKMKIQSTINNNLFVVGVSFLIVGALFLLGTLQEISPLLMLMGVFFLVATFIFRKKSVTIACIDGNTIELFYNNSNKTEVVAFAKQIMESSNKFLFNKYSRIDKDMPIDNQLSNLDFLRNRKIISEELLEDLKNQLLGRSNKSKIGFGA